MKKYYLSVIILFALLIGCSSEDLSKKSDAKIDTEELYTPDLKVKFKEVYSWVNLMPGPDAKPRFNITGEIEILPSVKYDLKYMDLSLINIYQNDEMVYSIKPEVRIDKSRSTDKLKLIIFSTIKGLLLDAKLDMDATVDAKFIFDQDNDRYSYFIEGIKINKAY